jgi:hypothetical protein
MKWHFIWLGLGGVVLGTILAGVIKKFTGISF